MKKLGEFSFGNIDGKKELSSYNKNNISNLEKVFFNHNECFEKLKEKQFLIIGEKGTGKTLLIEYFKEKKKKEDFSFLDLNIQEIIDKYLNIENSIKDIKYYFKWEILSNISKHLLEENFPNNKNEKKELEAFLTKSPFDKELPSSFYMKILNFMQNIKIKFKDSSYEYSENYKKFLTSFFKKIIFVSKNKPKKQFYLFIDEIDQILRNIEKKNCKKILEEVILTSCEINHKFKEENIDIRIIISIRKDIFHMLELTNANKIKEEAVLLEWGYSEDKNSPLFKLIFNKMRSQDKSLQQLSDIEIFEKLFEDNEIKISEKISIPIEKYILGKTFLHPRDMIAFFEKIPFSLKDNTNVSNYELQNIANLYSKHIYFEVKDALVGSISSEGIEEFFKLLKSLNKTIFKKEDLEKYIEENKSGFTKINKDNLWNYIQTFYKIGILGEIFLTINKKREERFSYKNENQIHISPKSEFTIHYGIRNYLGMSREIKIRNEKRISKIQKDAYLILGNLVNTAFNYNIFTTELKKNIHFSTFTDSQLKELFCFFIEKKVISCVKFSKRLNNFKKCDKPTKNFKKKKFYIFKEDYNNFLTE